ncbi:MAG: hypothetical protein R3280_06840 [Marinobacter sp.]|uniref:hypothetical protein n=1 Tax=Marinobacter sp. TaxID=50741 RepID=UPI00299CEEDB|nr:hypothetical protein [Marinobacter sp.]MDX1634332.1 hypothetical protein [Marinobacter sp.]
MDTPCPPAPDTDRPVHLDQHDSVRTHVCQRLSDEVRRLENRIESLRRTDAPHAAIIIATYERMIERKRGFMARWGLADRRNY